MEEQEAPLLAFVGGYIAERGYGPSNREIQKALQLSANTTQRVIHRLQAAGKITFLPERARSIYVVGDVTRPSGPRVGSNIRIPGSGPTVAAALPLLDKTAPPTKEPK